MYTASVHEPCVMNRLAQGKWAITGVMRHNPAFLGRQARLDQNVGELQNGRIRRDQCPCIPLRGEYCGIAFSRVLIDRRYRVAG